MTNGWTGGQYSVYRAVLGTYVTLHFVQLLPWGRELFSNAGALPDASTSPLFPLFPNVLFVFDAPFAVAALLSIGALCGVALIVGRHDRIAAVGAWYVLACLFGRNPLIANPSLPFIGWLLLAHACIRCAPYGSLTARGRDDPDGGWRLPSGLFGAAWIVMAVGYSYSGYTKLISPSWVDGSALARVLDNPLARPGPIRELLLELPDALLRAGTWSTLAIELLFAPLAIFSRVRPWLWLLMLSMHIALITVIDFADLSFGMIVLQLFTFDPAWVRSSADGATELLFYDGSCGLCHRTVRFILAEDRPGTRFRFAPLGGTTFETALTARQRSALPDSLVLRTSDDRLLTRSAAVLHIARRLGGLWRLLGTLFAAVPSAILDRLYDTVAAVRHRLFRRPAEACPLIPPRLRSRFLP